MPIDEQLLQAHASYSDASAGIYERFVSLQLRSGRTVGVLSAPLGDARPLGWVLCHSFAREQVDLLVADAILARRVAAAGYPVLRFQCQGYGDSEHPEFRAGLASHLADTEDAVAALRELGGVRDVGTIGSRFGGSVAALAAERLGLHDLVAIAPVVSGKRLMNELVRSLAMTQLASSAQGTPAPAASGEVLHDLMEELGYLDYKGYALTREVIEENSRMDLAKDLGPIQGRALLVQISVTEKEQAGIGRLARVLGASGARIGRATVLHRQATLYGQKHILITGPATNEDLFAALHREIAEAVVEWLETPSGAPPFASVRDAGDSLSRGRTHMDVEGEE